MLTMPSLSLRLRCRCCYSSSPLATVPTAGGRAGAAEDARPTLDARAAWHLLRAVRPDGGPSLRVPGSDPAVFVQVYPSGAWKTRARTTGEARDLLDLYLPLQLRTDLVIAQAGQSLDGRIATASGHSHYVTGPEDIQRLHRLRALVDAVIVGAGTIDADDPRLTVRRADGRNPVRVVIDPRNRLDRGRQVFRDGAAPTIVIRQTGAAGDGRRRGETAIALPADASGAIDPHPVLAALRARGLRRVLIEGGGVTLSRFLDAGAVDRLHVAVAPMVIGSGRPAFTLAPIATLDEALRPACRVFRLGNDVLFDLDLRTPASARHPPPRTR